MTDEQDTRLEIQLQRVIERFWETFPPVWDAVRGHSRTLAVENFGITFEQFHILRHVRRGVNTTSDLATIKQISRPAISQAVDVLVDKGLLTRAESAEDRRFTHLELTPIGNDLLNGLFAQNRAWMKAKMTSLTSEELDRLIAALELLKKIFVEQTE